MIMCVGLQTIPVMGKTNPVSAADSANAAETVSEAPTHTLLYSDS
jgi:hypothetical protein